MRNRQKSRQAILSILVWETKGYQIVTRVSSKLLIGELGHGFSTFFLQLKDVFPLTKSFFVSQRSRTSVPSLSNNDCETVEAFPVSEIFFCDPEEHSQSAKYFL